MSVISQEQTKEDRKIGKDNELSESYSYFSELRKKIILKEQEIAEKRNKELKQGHKNKNNKVTYRSFDEFYKYKKKCEDYESKIKNETWRHLNKNRSKERNNLNNNINLISIEKNDEKYSYTKFKMERAGTVKQLKDYFQQIQNEKLQKKNKSLIRKNNSKNYSTPLNDNNIIIEKNETNIKQNEFNQIYYITEHDHTNDLNIKTDYNNKIITKNIDFSGNSIALIKKNNNELTDDTKRNISIEREDTTEGGSTFGRGSTFERDEAEEIIDDEILDEEIENMDKTEINLLYNLINEMKKGNENDENYISNLIEELHNSNKGYMIEKILNILKKFDKNVKPYQISKLSGEFEESIISKELDDYPQITKNQIMEKREEWDGNLSEQINRDEINNSRKQSLNNETQNDEIKKEDKDDSQFEWFYSTMDDICKREINSSMDQNIVNNEIKEYSSDDSEKQNLFLWLNNKHVENVIIEESQIGEDTIE
ncbi:conserved Plasmodium protein, unknown function [Plasmodium berghei]|uniref:CCAAT-box DNA binding protein subunit B n=2 Tax=Plasmodium berghei TaxID=5821 RepID=A0A509ASJ1_PLABA|nr:conserved Plasmodium protein, unknown function [Plasmodium berghei ANKA]CXJ00533.1 conserved Plasmodium protein, unknown function [Plasmodium berghei]SCL98036.1 conserved Plasmodium protein, unknown function [Plasmodium berghei]SCM16737.1 conserved Plasmodium protein, unknown function [Plasmodium berghei]SCM18535.1 conserved Plasmodium protein, unknown function [Plasmodium berghei]SCN27968.1 conserved Plasmodium protein, unknown function [Plasmodium berghei]|eukprot:XP_034423621.1 conserved Plasmodium protein, unknown function [Plasmodium berghei ANKA]